MIVLMIPGRCGMFAKLRQWTCHKHLSGARNVSMSTEPASRPKHKKLISPKNDFWDFLGSDSPLVPWVQFWKHSGGHLYLIPHRTSWYQEPGCLISQVNNVQCGVEMPWPNHIRERIHSSTHCLLKAKWRSKCNRVASQLSMTRSGPRTG